MQLRKNAASRQRKPQSGFSWHLIIRYALIIVGIILLFPLYRFVRQQLLKNEEQKDDIEKTKKYNENQNPQIAQSKADKIVNDKGVQQAAKNLAHHLGTKYSDVPFSWTKPSTWSIFNPKGWTENDAEAAKILIYQRNNYRFLKRLYFEVYTNSRDLSSDVLSLLDDAELKKVQKYLKL
ncbi:hypothetical protein [Flavobacterium phycosphaerae]|uniref:hypothetical protein n=1 Tax=Flavobacterium phycosphaerae TaxID=2697515 RepID=UPI00138AADAA|nr:hypothetical protein [Flavobacterium phycosphaerae]